MSHSPTKTSPESVNINSNDNKVSTKKTDFKCTICSQKFSNIQECLKHELLQHDIKRAKRPQKTIRTKVNAILSHIKTDEQQAFQKELLNALHKSEPGQELCSIFKHHRMNNENLGLVYERIEACLYKELQQLRGLRLHPFGSIASGLALRDSDIDLYIEHVDTNLSTGNYTHRTFNRINNILQRSKCFSEVIPIRQARVPIIKCKHNPTGFSLDINLSCPSSVNNTKFVRDLLQFDNRIRELITFLKIWAKQLQLIGRGNMTSYCLITLVLFYLQQPQSNQPAVLPSIKELQDNVPDNLIVGVNYAYQLQEKISPLPRELTTSKLIEGFFKFYRCFEFESFLISPYLGEAVPLDEFKKGEISFPAYNNQLRAVAIVNNEPEQPLQVDRCVCVQDAFALSHNVGKSISQLNLEYFRNCLNLACDVYDDVNISTEAQRYETLLYGIIERMAQAVNINFAFTSQKADKNSTQDISNNSTSNVRTNNVPYKMNYSLTPSRSELRAIAAHIKDNNSKSIYKLWAEYYLEAISEIITDIFCLDMQSATPTQSDKQQRLEECSGTHTWILSGSVDQWSGRLHQRYHNKTFMELQLEQTKKFISERRQNAAYAVHINAILTLNILNNSTAIELIVTPRNTKSVDLIKNDPLRKFFASFKATMQNFNLKEKLKTNA
ncbi:terminal uridylyltransferase Tailor [Zeugodacus cucurbitae]|uniref:terminal uridylyltransferase Tailor n=1 Tax=Zeugodacus cucurbitae TaxID=28588 RepID=UPI0005969441|nr:terminal uridylyltransferase Tailor [Zeugodacus cucurbitae]XP_054084632.1 terminal uridylyltransferase Tailor [Zeugodacus cucurbitae]